MKDFNIDDLDLSLVLGKKIMDVHLMEDIEYDTLVIDLEGGVQIEIVLHEKGFVHVQTD